jgi:hypothetical protein
MSIYGPQLPYWCSQVPYMRLFFFPFLAKAVLLTLTWMGKDCHFESIWMKPFEFPMASHTGEHYLLLSLARETPSCIKYILLHQLNFQVQHNVVIKRCITLYSFCSFQTDMKRRDSTVKWTTWGKFWKVEWEMVPEDSNSCLLASWDCIKSKWDQKMKNTIKISEIESQMIIIILIQSNLYGNYILWLQILCPGPQVHREFLIKILITRVCR